MNNNLDELMGKANRAYGQGLFAECKEYCRQVLERLPNSVPALVLQGIATSNLGDKEAAVVLFEKAVAVDSRCAPAFLWLSMSQLGTGRAADALTNAKKAVALNPGDPIGQHQVGRCQLELGQVEVALATFQRAVTLAPNVALVHLSLGLAFQASKRNEDAIRAVRRSIQSDREGLLEAAQTIVKLQPESGDARVWLAQAFLDLNRSREAESAVRDALDMDPTSAQGHLILGSINQMRGKLDEASIQFRQSIEIQPKQGAAYLALVTNRRVGDQDRGIVESMIELVNAPDLSTVDKGQLHYALGKAHEDLGAFPDAIAHWDQANQIAYSLKFGDRQFDRKAAQNYGDSQIETFNRGFLERNSGRGSDSTTPIFVLGMIRSGTTLVEQILSCHPDVAAGGELAFWGQNGGAFVGANRTLDASLLAKFADRYERLLKSIDASRPRVVDKMPTNYQLIGLINLAFPKAKIIHVQRDPIDTCLSIYATPNRTKHPWAHDKSNIVFNYRIYQRLMDHWRSVISPESMLEIRYEDLVSDLEGVSQSIVEFCELSWNDACLRPQDNDRSVVTPSVWQVRQPVYRTSVSRAKRFEGLLGPFSTL